MECREEDRFTRLCLPFRFVMYGQNRGDYGMFFGQDNARLF